MSTQPEAMRLYCDLDVCDEAADELRRQHALIAELVEALKCVQTAIYVDEDDGRLRLSRSFDDSVVYDAIAKAGR